MSEFKFKEGQSIYFTPKHSHEAKKAFTVASVNEEGQATSVKLEHDAPSPSEALNIAIQKTGATSGRLGHDSNTVLLSHGHKATSPHYSPERDFG